MPTNVTVTHDITPDNAVADLKAFLAEVERAGLDGATLHVKTKVDWGSRNGARLTQITAGGGKD